MMAMSHFDPKISIEVCVHHRRATPLCAIFRAESQCAQEQYWSSIQCISEQYCSYRCNFIRFDVPVVELPNLWRYQEPISVLGVVPLGVPHSSKSETRGHRHVRGRISV